MRIQLARVFKKYVSPNTPVEMLKKKGSAEKIIESHLQNGKVVERLLTPPHLGR